MDSIAVSCIFMGVAALANLICLGMVLPAKEFTLCCVLFIVIMYRII